MSTMTYLSGCSDTTEHNGSTVVWPRSSRKLEALAATDPERFALMWDLGAAMAEAEVGTDGAEVSIEVRHSKGDVLFYDSECDHSLAAPSLASFGLRALDCSRSLHGCRTQFSQRTLDRRIGVGGPGWP